MPNSDSHTHLHVPEIRSDAGQAKQAHRDSTSVGGAHVSLVVTRSQIARQQLLQLIARTIAQNLHPPANLELAMLKNRFNPDQALQFVRYGRMSSDNQNPRSPDQQFNTIDDTRRRCGYNKWQHVRDYRDDGISGRKIRQRKGLQSLLQDIKSCAINVDLILVDTYERFGRADEMAEIRRELDLNYGVFILTADSGFADPTSVSGRALGFVESFRSTEDNRIKSHNVARGKKDAVLQKKWPGGVPPFGCKLESVFKEINGRQEVDYSRLVPDLEAARVIQLLFEKAKSTDFGATRLVRFLNDHPEISEKFKPFDEYSVLYWLHSEIYFGQLIWQRTNTEFVDDRTVRQTNSREEQTIVPDYCEPLVSFDDWKVVQKKIAARASRMNLPKATDDEKLITPLSRGIFLKYPMTGLVLCDSCGRAMTPASSPIYVTVDGQERRYVGYTCPASHSGICPNKRRIPEQWLRQVTIQALLTHLMYPATESHNNCDFQNSPMFQEVVALVQCELTQRAEQRPSRYPALKAEEQELQQQIEGWGRSLGRPDLADVVRRDLEKRWDEAGQRMAEIANELAAEQSLQQRREFIVDPKSIAEAVKSLGDSVSVIDPSGANLILSMHIDSIRCRSSGRVTMRTCKLGIVPNALRLIQEFSDSESHERNGCDSQSKSKPRRRARRSSASVESLSWDEADAMEFALDPHRFAGLADRFFWIDEFEIPEPTCWSKEHAAEVAAKRAEGMTHEELAAHFDVTIPTIRKAIKFALAADPTLQTLPQKLPRVRWHELHAPEVKQLKDQGWSTDAIAEYFNKSDTTIRTALKYAQDNGF